MKGFFDYINDAINEAKAGKRFDRATIEEKCPKFFSIISQFCRDKNSEELEFLIDSWTMSPDDFDNLYKKNDFPFSAKDIEEFETKYLTPEAIEEVEKISAE